MSCYPITCAGGFFVPIRNSGLRVLGCMATVNDTTANSRVVLIDDPGIALGAKWGRILPTTHDNRKGFIDVKGLGGVDANLFQILPDSLKIRHGISAVETSNIIAGTLKIFVE